MKVAGIIMVLLALITTLICADSVGAEIEKFSISRDDSVYECFPSLTQTKSGRLVLVYRESEGHVVNEFCRLIVRTSDDGGKSFSDKLVLVDVKKDNGSVLYYNCPKVQQLKDGRVLISCDVFANPPGPNHEDGRASHIVFWFSEDNAESWSEPLDTDVHGIMPDEVIELENGEWLLATQYLNPKTKEIMQCVARSSDGGKSWSEPSIIAARDGFNLCESSILKTPEGQLICYMRENSNKGLPMYKSISNDGGKTWKGPYQTQIHGGHRPVAHLTSAGRVLITYRHTLGGLSPYSKNVFAFIEGVASALESDISKQCGVLLPLDHDRSRNSDCGYTGWVELAPGEFFAVAYIKDDAPMAQIRGYRFKAEDF